MGKQKKKLVKLIAIISVIIAIGFFVNWFLSYRLEKLLREELSTRVSTATDGFYFLDFEKLSVGLFSGELSISGVVFKPDSATFNRLSSQKKLPQTYADISIGEIYFKGINLSWKFNYKELHFGLFEIKNPIINIHTSKSFDQGKEATESQTLKTPYEMISKYINLLTVRKVSLENADILYFIEGGANSSLYTLKNVSFHAYDFRLDENSYDSGKLLYSDNFDFYTHEPQILLANNQFTLNADAIKLDTKDSLILINQIQLIPQKMLWAQANLAPDTYIEASVDSLQIKGLVFTRENKKNTLEAKTFEVLSSNILYFDTKNDTKQVNPKDSIDLSWSLYTIVSPLFEKISIDTIGIRDAELAYSLKTKKNTDLYKMGSFNFEATNFLVDSLEETQHRFLYSDGFRINANNIDAKISSHNYMLSLDEMLLNTNEGTFDLKKVNLWPISTNTDVDYMKGYIDSLGVSGIVYKEGLRINEFTVYAPSLEYVKMPPKVKHYVRAERIDTIYETTVPLHIVSPFLKFLSIGSFRLNDGNITFNDRRNPSEVMTYNIPEVDFYADSILVNKETLTKLSTYVAYNNFNINFARFDNLLPGKEHRLIIRRGYYDGNSGDLRLDNTRLIPNNKSGVLPALALDLSIPLVNIKSLNFDKRNEKNIFKSRSINIDRPEIHLTRNSDSGVNKKSETQKPDFIVDLGTLNISKANITYHDRTTKDSSSFSLNKLGLKSFEWNSGERLLVDEIFLQAPTIRANSHATAKVEGQKKDSVGNVRKRFIAEEILIKKIDVENLKIDLDRPDLKLNTSVQSILFRNINHSDKSSSIEDVQVLQPIVRVNQMVDSKKITQASTTSSHTDGIYTTIGRLSNNLSVENFAIVDAEIDYRNTLNGRSDKHQKINSTNFNFTGFSLDVEKEKFNVEDFNFTTRNLSFPLDNGFYTLKVGEVEVHKKDAAVRLNDINFISAYPKEEFAMNHPKSGDWFDVSVKSVALEGIDYPTYFSSKVLNIRDFNVSDVTFLNYKDQNVEREHHAMPLIYARLQKAPIQMSVENLAVNNFMVKYEELPKGAAKAGEILFTDMNGRFEGFTNIISKEQQYIKLEADGKLMGTGDFVAEWYLPVDSLNDRFLLVGKLHKFNLTDLNPLIMPMAPIEVYGGQVDSLIFKTEGSSKGAQVQMRFIYNDLNVGVLKGVDDDSSPNKFYSVLANKVLRKNNPSKIKGKPREPNMSIVRDPYHSTFNYIWQILQPPVTESVGISRGTQHFARRMSGFISKIKSFFKQPDTPAYQGDIE